MSSPARTRRLADPDFQGTVVEWSLRVSIALASLLAVFVIHDGWVWTHPPQPKFFYVDGHSTPRAAVALDSPIVNDSELLQWTVRWAVAPYNINYRDYPTQLNDAGQHYTLSGWNSFAESYIKSGNFGKMREARLLCYGQPLRAAVIKGSSIHFGRLFYDVQVPIIQTCENVNQSNTQGIMLNVEVERVQDEDHPDGLAISQLVAVVQ